MVGQVVGSLFSGGAAAVRPLAGLFRAAAPPPVLVAVPRVSSAYRDNGAVCHRVRLGVRAGCF